MCVPGCCHPRLYNVRGHVQNRLIQFLESENTMDLHQLRVFHAAVAAGGFTRAGEELHLSQSTVSQHIKLLEDELGCPLFLRVGKRVQVTEAGRVLLSYAERIFRDLKNAEMAVREMNALRRGTVRLGVGPTTLTYRQPGLSMKPLGREEMVFVVSQDHPLARRRTIEPQDLSSLRFILYEKNTVMQNFVDRYFEALGITPKIIMEVENNEAIKSLVRAGLGCSLLPLCAVENEPPEAGLRILRVRGKPLIRRLRLASAGAEVFPRAIAELAQAITGKLAGSGGSKKTMVNSG